MSFASMLHSLLNCFIEVSMVFLMRSLNSASRFRLLERLSLHFFVGFASS